MTAECNYGGRVTDEKDGRMLKVLMEVYYQKDLANIDNFELSNTNPEYFVPYFASHAEYLKFIDGLPFNAPPGVYGFHANANITKELNETSAILDTLLKCQGGGGGTGSDDSYQVRSLLTSDRRFCD